MIETVKSVCETAFYVATLVAALFSACTYWKNSRRERTKWLFELYQRFYEEPGLKPIWRHVDGEGTSFLEQRGESVLTPQLDELLNFFEFIALLRDREELEQDEIKDLFAYPLKTLGEDGRLRSYVANFGYEHLDALLADLGYTRARAA